jgi:chaperone required for assembly of F1-ATPase
MRDIFEDVFKNQPLDPTEVTRRAMRPQLRRRFYERVEIEAVDDAFRIVLDGRPVRTPARHALAAPTRALAQALAAEWEAQRDVVDPARMPLTRLANTIIDGVVEAPGAVAAEVERYLACDLVFYRASAPAGLVARQGAAWDPVLAWARDALGARFVLAEGIVFVTQPPQALAAAGAAIPRAPWPLGAVHSMTTLTGSALIALAVAAGALSVDAAWAAAHVDEDWNMDFWGRDELAMQRRDTRFADMQAAGTVLAHTE